MHLPASFGNVVWGNPACAENPLFRLETCCYSGPSADEVLLRRTCFPPPLNPDKCCVTVPQLFGERSPRRLFNLTGSILTHPALEGCLNHKWQAFFAWFRAARGCLPCFGTEDLVKKWMRGHNAIGPEVGCPLGLLLSSFSRVLAFALWRRVDAAKAVAQEMLQKNPWAWGISADSKSLPEETFFDLSGHTPTELLYVMDQLISAHLEPLQERSTRHGEPKFIFDFGTQGGGDLNYYIFQKGAKTLGIDADSQRMASVQARLSQKQHASWELFVALVASGQEDMSNKIGDHVKDEGAERFSCAQIAARFPWNAAELNAESYWKIDLDGYDLSCLRSLLHEQGPKVPRWRPQYRASPRFISVEFAHVYQCRFDPTSSCVAAAEKQRNYQLDILHMLSALGYRRFKLVRQRFYNLLTTAHFIEEGWDRDPEGMIQRFGSGLIGDEAVDYVSGTRWRSYSDILHEVMFLELEAQAGSPDEWYDLHAALDST